MADGGWQMAESYAIRHPPSALSYFVRTVTSALDPAGTRSAAGPFHEMRTGIRCTTFTKLPLALSGGNIEKLAPVPPERDSTFPSKSSPPAPALPPGRFASIVPAPVARSPERVAAR